MKEDALLTSHLNSHPCRFFFLTILLLAMNRLTVLYLRSRRSSFEISIDLLPWAKRRTVILFSSSVKSFCFPIFQRVQLEPENLHNNLAYLATVIMIFLFNGRQNDLVRSSFLLPSRYAHCSQRRRTTALQIYLFQTNISFSDTNTFIPIQIYLFQIQYKPGFLWYKFYSRCRVRPGTHGFAAKQHGGRWGFGMCKLQQNMFNYIQILSILQNRV